MSRSPNGIAPTPGAKSAKTPAQLCKTRQKAKSKNSDDGKMAKFPPGPPALSGKTLMMSLHETTHIFAPSYRDDHTYLPCVSFFWA